MNIQRIKTPRGEELIVLSAADYEALIDARDHALAMAAHERGEDPGLIDAEMDAWLAAASPLAFWRKKRALSQAALAAKAGVSQPFVAQIESGKRHGTIAIYRRLARALGVRPEDLLP